MRLLLFAIALTAGGCSAEPGTVIVELRTDYRPGVDFASVHTELLDVRRPITLDVDAEDDFRSGLRVAELNDIEGGAHDLSVTLLSASGVTVAERRMAIEVDGPTAVSVEIISSGIDAGMDASDAFTEGGVDADAGDAIDATTCEVTELACADGLDDDCDGTTDCEDSDCAGATCDDGIYCNGVDSCGSGGCDDHPGDPCVSPSTCNEDMDRCEGCMATGCPADEPGAWGACGGFADSCDATGERSRSVTQYTCTSDACEASVVTETEACTRADRDGLTCGATTMSDGMCMRTAECGTAGSFTRTTTTRTCMGGSCQSSGSMAIMSCSLAPASDGTSCSSGYCCSGLCVPKNSDGHCGACGVSCATGQTCTNAVSNNGGRHNLPDAWVCTCLGFADCTAYGAGAACFDGHCQCTCPSGSGARTCTGQCSAGTCFMDTIEPMSDNYCGY